MWKRKLFPTKHQGGKGKFPLVDVELILEMINH